MVAGSGAVGRASQGPSTRLVRHSFDVVRSSTSAKKVSDTRLAMSVVSQNTLHHVASAAWAPALFLAGSGHGGLATFGIFLLDEVLRLNGHMQHVWRVRAEF